MPAKLLLLLLLPLLLLLVLAVLAVLVAVVAVKEVVSQKGCGIWRLAYQRPASNNRLLFLMRISSNRWVRNWHFIPMKMRATLY